MVLNALEGMGATVKSLVLVESAGLAARARSGEVGDAEASEGIISHEGFRPHHAFYSVPGEIPEKACSTHLASGASVLVTAGTGIINPGERLKRAPCE